MLGTEHIGLFMMAGLLLNMMPGPDTFYILARTLAQGRGAGVASVLGISAGSLVHTISAACGLSALLVASAHAFMAVKLAGCLYLIYLGVRMLTAASKQETMDEPALSHQSFGVIFRQAVFTNVLNPKVAVFFLAFLPQFVADRSHNPAVPFLFLGCVFVFNGTLYCLLLVLLASALARRLKANQTFSSLIGRLTGALFVFLGIKLALQKA
jgi:threonine/homoserine/homoserine lactone efflux protein